MGMFDSTNEEMGQAVELGTEICSVFGSLYGELIDTVLATPGISWQYKAAFHAAKLGAQALTDKGQTRKVMEASINWLANNQERLKTLVEEAGKRIAEYQANLANQDVTA